MQAHLLTQATSCPNPVPADGDVVSVPIPITHQESRLGENDLVLLDAHVEQRLCAIKEYFLKGNC